MNAVLTVRAHEAASHAGRGWETFTDAVVRAIAQRKEGIVYMLWGSYAQKKGAIADPRRNLILKAVHPSPLSVYRGFFGCRHFRAPTNTSAPWARNRSCGNPPRPKDEKSRPCKKQGRDFYELHGIPYPR